MGVINSEGLAIIKEFEGCAFRAYKDGAGIWTCGYGHTAGVTPETVCTQELADKWLQEDLEFAQNAVIHYISVPLNPNQFSALVSFTFNEGPGHLEESTIRKKLDAQDFRGAADAILLWDKVRGVPCAGLDRRRQAERTLFLS